MISKTEKEDNSVMDQVIYTLDTICDPNIKTLAQAVLDILCSRASNVMKMRNFQKGNNSAMTNPMDKKKNMCLLNFHTLPTYQISKSYL